MQVPAATFRIRSFAALTALGLVACGGARSSEPITLTGHALPGCGPADGPAIEIYLSQADSSPPVTITDSLSMLRLVPSIDAGAGRLQARAMIWRAGSQLARRTFTFDDGSTAGSAALCRLDAGCEAVTAGWLRIDAIDETRITGGLELRTASGALLTGGFHADRVSRPVLCG